MDPAVVTIFLTIIGIVITSGYNDKEDRRKEIFALAGFIDRVSDSLLGMHKKLSNGEVPTTEGNQLVQELRAYPDIIFESRIDKQSRQDLESLLPELEKILLKAEFEDEIIRGVVLSYSPDLREKLLHKLEKTAGRLKGISAVLQGRLAR